MPSHYLPIRRTRGFRSDLTASPDPCAKFFTPLCASLLPSFPRLRKCNLASHAKNFQFLCLSFLTHFHSFKSEVFFLCNFSPICQISYVILANLMKFALILMKPRLISLISYVFSLLLMNFL